MTSEALLLLFISFALLHLKPGPGQAFRVGCALDRGFACAFAVSLGVSVMCVIYFVVVALSYNSVIQQFESFANTFKVLGGLSLIYMGVKGFIRLNSPNVTVRTKPSRKSVLKFFFVGIVISLSNPMDIVFFLSILPNLITLAELTPSGIAMGAAVLFFTGMIIDVFTLTVIVLAKESITESLLGKYLSIFTNIAFILIGALFVFSALFFGEYKLNIL